MLETGASGSVGGKGGNILVYPATLAGEAELQSSGAADRSIVFQDLLEVISSPGSFGAATA
jgi:hypothetical protein